MHIYKIIPVLVASVDEIKFAGLWNEHMWYVVHFVHGFDQSPPGSLVRGAERGVEKVVVLNQLMIIHNAAFGPLARTGLELRETQGSTTVTGPLKGSTQPVFMW